MDESFPRCLPSRSGLRYSPTSASPSRADSIVATRSYGSDPDTILAMALRNVKAFQRAGIAATAKHWPGEGFDDRDQHLVTTLNPLSEADWRRALAGSTVA